MAWVYLLFILFGVAIGVFGVLAVRSALESYDDRQMRFRQGILHDAKFEREQTEGILAAKIRVNRDTLYDLQEKIKVLETLAEKHESWDENIKTQEKRIKRMEEIIKTEEKWRPYFG